MAFSVNLSEIRGVRVQKRILRNSLLGLNLIDAAKDILEAKSSSVFIAYEMNLLIPGSQNTDEIVAFN